ncbi:hypothetical protein CJU90_5452 [Yarrowia sp. C11]|nr:hypothetical protein CJU90_5452 [Yarrowia sp. C11]KAG5364046.1 hypothetical protein CKK34_2831 [Yarrowia sp. E02]
MSRQVSWVNTDPPLWESQVGPGQWGMPLISQKAFGDSDLHWPTENHSLPLTPVGQSLTVFESGFRTFVSPQEGDFVKTTTPKREAESKVPFAELHANFAAEREMAMRKSSMLLPVDIGPKMTIAEVEWEFIEVDMTRKKDIRKIMAHVKGTEVIVDVVAPRNNTLDPAYVTDREEFDYAVPSLHHLVAFDFKREINQVLFDHPVGSGHLSTRLLVRTTAATYITDVQEKFTTIAIVPYNDLRDDKYIDCDLHGNWLAGVTADGTWRIHSLETDEETEWEDGVPPIIAQGYDPNFEVLSDWKSIKLFDGGKMALATRKGLRLFTINDDKDPDAEPTFVELFHQQHSGDVIMDMKKDVKYPSLLVVASAARLIVYDTSKEKQHLQIARTLNLHAEDYSIKLSMSLVEGKSIAIIHSQLSVQKLFFTYAYTNPEEPLLLEWTCDPYPIMLSTQTPINSTVLVDFSDAIVMLFDIDIDECVVRKLLTSEPSKFQDYKPEPVWKFPGTYKNGPPQHVRMFNIDGYDKIMLAPPFPDPVSVADIAGNLDNLIKTWHKDGCPGGRTSLADLGANDIPSSIDEFGDMLTELQKHYDSSAVRVRLSVDPVKKYEELMSIYVTPSDDSSDRGNSLLRKYIIEYRIKTERDCRRLAAMSAYAACSVRRSREDKGKEKDVPVHVTKLLDEWVVGAPPKTNYDDWQEFGVRKKKRQAPTQQELLSQLAASRNAIPKLSLSSQVPSQRLSQRPSQRASLAPSSSHRSSLARVASQSSRRQSEGPAGSQGSHKRSKRRKTLGGFR